MTDYTLLRSNRRTIAIYIRAETADASPGVEVRAPLRVSKREIDSFVALKEGWILKQLETAKTQAERRKANSLDYGSAVYYKGKQYIIKAGSRKFAGICDDCFYMPAGLNHENIKAACIRIYRILAKNDLLQKTYDYAARMDIIPASVSITSAKTRWGSCNNTGNINYSWQLIMAHEDVIDYVCVHELAHLIELNHSKRFWAEVERVLPDYKKRRVRLREFQRRLSEEDWD